MNHQLSQMLQQHANSPTGITATWNFGVILLTIVNQSAEVRYRSRKPSYTDWYDVVNRQQRLSHLFSACARKYCESGFTSIVRSTLPDSTRKRQILNPLMVPRLNGIPAEKEVSQKNPPFVPADVHDNTLYQEHFDWLISQFDKLRHALEIVGK